VRRVGLKLKAGSMDLLSQAIEGLGYVVTSQTETGLEFMSKSGLVVGRFSGEALSITAETKRDAQEIGDTIRTTYTETAFTAAAEEFGWQVETNEEGQLEAEVPYYG
jgi:hypothetical protein